MAQEVSGGLTSGAVGGGMTYVALMKTLSDTVSPNELALQLGVISENNSTAAVIHTSPIVLTTRREFCFVSPELQVLENWTTYFMYS